MVWCWFSLQSRSFPLFCLVWGQSDFINACLEKPTVVPLGWGIDQSFIPGGRLEGLRIVLMRISFLVLWCSGLNRSFLMLVFPLVFEIDTNTRRLEMLR